MGDPRRSPTIGPQFRHTPLWDKPCWGWLLGMVRRWINIFPEVFQFFVGIPLALAGWLAEWTSARANVLFWCFVFCRWKRDKTSQQPYIFERRTNLLGSWADPCARCLEDCRINMKWVLLLPVRTAYTHNSSGFMVRNWFVLIGPSFLLKVHSLFTLNKASSLCLRFNSFFLECSRKLLRAKKFNRFCNLDRSLINNNIFFTEKL